VFVFVDECHRTQSGKLHRVMKAMMPNAVFIGFTGTPLLKKDKADQPGGLRRLHPHLQVQRGGGGRGGARPGLRGPRHRPAARLQDKIDAWFEAKTKGLNDWQKDELKKQWGTMQKVLSSRSRMDGGGDIVFDFSVKPRLSSERGNAMLVASSIYEACKYFELFQKTPFQGQVRGGHLLQPAGPDVTKEETGANTETDKQFIYNTYTELLKDVDAKPGKTKTETYEDEAKALFIKSRPT
jgi:type I restriction enzyme, R subunit